MGILNVTPDSFSDGGRYLDTQQAIARGMTLIADGADIVDVGGESTRPGAMEVSASEEICRVVPVIKALSERSDVVISVDTMKASVAEAAIAAGASIINDVSALTRDAKMSEIALKTGAGVVLMHMQGKPATMQNSPTYKDVVADVRNYLQLRIDDLLDKGLVKESLAIDPGIGFGKTMEHNIELLANLDDLETCGVPVVVGLSRKSFLGKLTGCSVDDRLTGSLAALVFCVLNGAHVMRVHDVKESCEATAVAIALKEKRAHII